MRTGRITGPRGRHAGLIAEAMYRALDSKFREDRYFRFREVRIGVENPGHRPSYKRIDYWAIERYSEKGPPTTYAIEIKTKRRDFLNELGQPEKQRAALMYSNLFYFCAPKGMIRLKELPPYAGLLEFANANVLTTVKAPWRDETPRAWTSIRGDS